MARSSKRRKAKTKFKVTKPLIFLLLFLVVIAIATGLLGITSKKDKLYNKITSAQSSVASDADQLNEDNVYKEISYKSLTSKIKRSAYTYVYYGSYSDSTYLTYIETINQRAQTYDVKTVYLLDSSWTTHFDIEDEDNGEEDNIVITELEKKLDDVDLLTAPQLWVFKEGKVVFNSKDYTTDVYQTAPWKYVIEQAFGNYNTKDWDN